MSLSSNIPSDKFVKEFMLAYADITSGKDGCKRHYEVRLSGKKLEYGIGGELTRQEISINTIKNYALNKGRTSDELAEINMTLTEIVAQEQVGWFAQAYQPLRPALLYL